MTASVAGATATQTPSEDGHPGAPQQLDLQLVASEVLWMNQVGYLKSQQYATTRIHLQLPSGIPAAVAADGIRLLCNFPHLCSLRIRLHSARACITTPLIAAIAELFPLRQLELHQGRLSPQAELGRWSSLQQLEHLHLLLGLGQGVSDDHVAALSCLTGLKKLQLRGHRRRLTAAGLSRLTAFQQLQELGVTPAGRHLTGDLLQQLVDLPQLQLLRLGMQHSRQVLHVTSVTFPRKLQLQMALVDPRHLRPSEVLSVLSWCLPRTLVALQLGTVRSDAPGDVLLLLGMLSRLDALSLQVTAIPSKHMGGTMELTKLSSLTRLTSLECIVSERVYLPLAASTVADLAAAWPRLQRLVLSVAGKLEVQPAALAQLSRFTCLTHLQLHYPLPEDLEPTDKELAAEAAAAARRAAEEAGASWWGWLRGSVLGPSAAAGDADASDSDEQHEGESDSSADASSSSSSEGEEEEEVWGRVRASLSRQQQKRLSRSASGMSNNSSSSSLRTLLRRSSLGAAAAAGAVGAAASSGGAAAAAEGGGGPLSPHWTQQQMVQQQLQRTTAAPGSPLKRSTAAPVPGNSSSSSGGAIGAAYGQQAAPGAQEGMASSRSGYGSGSSSSPKGKTAQGLQFRRDGAAADTSSAGDSGWGSMLGAFCVAPAQLRFLSGGLTAVTAAGQPLTGSTPNPILTQGSWSGGAGSSSSSSRGAARSASLGSRVPERSSSTGYIDQQGPGGPQGSGNGNVWGAGTGLLQPLSLAGLPRGLKVLNLQGYQLQLGALQHQRPQVAAAPDQQQGGADLASHLHAEAAGSINSSSSTNAAPSQPHGGASVPDPTADSRGHKSADTPILHHSSTAATGCGGDSTALQLSSLGELQELELEECGAGDALLLSLLPQLHHLQRLCLKGVLGVTDGALASLPALTDLTELVVEAGEQQDDMSLAGLWAAGQLTALRRLTWACHDQLQPPVQVPHGLTQPCPSAQELVRRQSSRDSSSGGAVDSMVSAAFDGLCRADPVLHYLAGLKALRQLQLVVDEPFPSQLAAAEQAAQHSSMQSSHSADVGAGYGAADATSGCASDQQAAAESQPEYLQELWQAALGEVLPMCHISIGYHSDLVLENDLDVWRDL